MHKVKIKSKRQLDAQHAADRAVLLLRAQRAGQVLDATGATIVPPTPEQVEKYRGSDAAVPSDTAEPVEQFAVGGCGGGCAPPVNCTPAPPVCRPTSINDCYHEVATKYGCPMKVTSGGQLNVDGESRISFIVEPTQSNFFLPIAVRLSARARNDPDQLMVWRLTAVMVKNQPQENYHQPNPSADTMTGVESTAYFGKTSGDVPGFEVAWGPFSRKSNAEHLELVGWNLYPPGSFMHPRAEIWGYELDALPAGWACGRHPGLVDGNTPSHPPTTSAPVG